MSLWQDFSTHDGKLMHKWPHYFPIYERHFSWYRNKSLTFLEIGVARGGSATMWQRYFGPLAKIVGIDIEEKFKEHEAPGIFIRIGDQSDEKFLQSVIDEFGVPDVVLMMVVTAWITSRRPSIFYIPRCIRMPCTWSKTCTPRTGKNTVGGGVANPDTFIEVSKRFIDQLNADHSRGQIEPTFITRQTFGISFYDSVVVFEKGDVWRKEVASAGHKPIFGR